MRKLVVIAIVGLGLLAVVGFSLKLLFDRMQKSFDEMAAAQWTEIIDPGGQVKINCPISLQRRVSPLIPQSRRVLRETVSYDGQAIGIRIVVHSNSFHPGIPVNLDKSVKTHLSAFGKTEGGIENIERSERTIFGARAMEVKAVFRSKGIKRRFQAIYFIRGNTFYQMRLQTPLQFNTEPIWARMVASVGSSDPSAPASPAVNDGAINTMKRSPAIPVLPQGMQRRNLSGESPQLKKF